jgi:hypothetical protein
MWRAAICDRIDALISYISATQSGILWLWPGDALGLDMTTDTRLYMCSVVLL